MAKLNTRTPIAHSKIGSTDHTVAKHVAKSKPGAIVIGQHREATHGQATTLATDKRVQVDDATVRCFKVISATPHKINLTVYNRHVGKTKR